MFYTVDHVLDIKAICIIQNKKLKGEKQKSILIETVFC